MEKVINDISEHFLFPSTLFVDRNPYQVQTILGSCVSVCLYDIKLGFGGINHYMLPWWNGRGIPSPKYGDVATDLLVDKMVALGSNKSNLIAKVFGGASQHHHERSISIGERNIVTAESILNKHHINIVGKSVGGMQGRKIIFHTSTGQVFMKYLELIKAKTNSPLT